MRILLKLLALIAVVGALALVVYALVFDLPAPQRDIVIPVEQR
jgi:hypothetical protein